MAHNIEELVRVAVVMRVAGMGWAVVAERVNRKTSTVTKWPRVFSEHWKKYWKEATRLYREEAGAEAIAFLRESMRNKNVSIQLKAVDLALKHLYSDQPPTPDDAPPGPRDGEIDDADDKAARARKAEWMAERTAAFFSVPRIASVGQVADLSLRLNQAGDLSERPEFIPQKASVRWIAPKPVINGVLAATLFWVAFNAGQRSAESNPAGRERGTSQARKLPDDRMGMGGVGELASGTQFATSLHEFFATADARAICNPPPGGGMGDHTGRTAPSRATPTLQPIEYMSQLINGIPAASKPSTPLDVLTRSLQRTSVCRFFERIDEQFPDAHLKDVTVEATRPGRQFKVRGRWLTNFGSDSFLGLDEDPRLHDAVQRGLRKWGTHNGTSRMFSSVAANVEAERRLARWLGAEAVLIYPSVTLLNHAALPALVTRHDLIAADHHAHHSIREGMEIALARRTRTAVFAHNNLDDLERVLTENAPYRHALVAVDGMYSMSGTLAPLKELNALAVRRHAVLYVDDAHGTGVVGDHGRGTVAEVLGSYGNVLAVGSLSKALSCAGGFIACSAEMQRVLKMRSSAFIFGGPVPPPYLEAICAAIDILESSEYATLKGRLDANRRQLTAGLDALGLSWSGGSGPIISVRVGAEDTTMQAGKFLFDRGFYVQSVTLPAVPAGRGVLRIQVNANHCSEQVETLLVAMEELRDALRAGM